MLKNSLSCTMWYSLYITIDTLFLAESKIPYWLDGNKETQIELTDDTCLMVVEYTVL